jgi:hypothetical protein
MFGDVNSFPELWALKTLNSNWAILIFLILVHADAQLSFLYLLI